MLFKSTYTFATHEIPLECDVYTAVDYPTNSPVVLFFHSGGLVGGARTRIPPWLVQVCVQRRWPLVSPSYRLLPQAGKTGLLQDVKAAYEFASKLEPLDLSPRKVIVAGASAGFFMATLTAHHLQPSPLALLSITGITTFRHPFFNSSVLLTPEPITDAEVNQHVSGPVVVGQSEAGDAAEFVTEKLLSSGAKNLDYNAPAPASSVAGADVQDGVPRGCLYDYYLYKNEFVRLVGDLDPGFEWAKEDGLRDRRNAWPATIIIQGTADEDVDMGVSTYMAECIGEKVQLFLAEDQGHLFEATNYLEDSGPGMEAVRDAVACLDRIIQK